MEKTKYITINKDSLWKHFQECIDNLTIEDGLRLHKIRFSDSILEDDKLIISDIAVDECDLVYIIEQKRKIVLIYNREKNTFSEISRESGQLPPELKNPLGIAIDKDTLYILDEGDDTEESQKLFALARSNLNIRWILSQWPEADKPNNITTIVNRFRGEKLFLLDQNNNRVFECPVSREGKIIITHEYSVDLSQPTDIAVDDKDIIYVLGKFPDKERKAVFMDDGKEVKNIPIPVNLSPAGLVVDDRKQIYFGEDADGGDDSFKTLHILNPDQTITPIWSYRGATKRLVLDSKDNFYIIGQGEEDDNQDEKGDKLTWVGYNQKNKNSLDKKGFFRATYTSRPINSYELKTHWHRFLLEGDFKEGTKVEFFYYASDKLDDITADCDKIPWKNTLSDSSAIQGKKKRDALFIDNVKGQYFRFKLTLTGNEDNSPVVEQLTLFFPRQSYLNELPVVYQEDLLCRDFLERFLSIFETINYDIDFIIDHLSRYLDALGTPSEFLSWLGAWVGVSVDENWPEQKKRLLIQKAVSLYKQRGTSEGLEAMIELYTDQIPFIVEPYFFDTKPENQKEQPPCEKPKTIFLPSSSEKTPAFKITDKTLEKLKSESAPDNILKKLISIKNCVILEEKEFISLIKQTIGEGLTDQHKEAIVEHANITELIDHLYIKEPFCFTVLLNLKEEQNNSNSLNTIQRIIEEQKPAHTCYHLKVLDQWFYLNKHTYLGINTFLTRAEFILGRKSVIGKDTVLDDPEQRRQVEQYWTVGIDISG